MSKRQLIVEWSKVENASLVRKKLRLAAGEDTTFTCPVRTCLHFPFKSKRGCRKHVDTKHGWYYHFDCAPVLTANDKEEATVGCERKAFTRDQPSYTLSAGIGKELVMWLCTPCGGSKKEGDARQSAARALKYLMFSSGDNSEEVLTHNFIDCCLGSTVSLNLFLKEIQTVWRLKSSGCYNYLKSIADLMDFRKAHGVKDNVLRSFAVTEVYLRRGMKSLSRKKQAEWSRNLTLEKLIAGNSWATLTEMEEVLPYHSKRFGEVVQKCRSASEVVGVQDLVFATRFLTTLLFLKVKCARPMTYQYLTVDMIQHAKLNGGYVDQTQFKTHATYTFDTLILDKDVMQLIDVYVDVCRPKLFPKCPYLLVNTNGNMCHNLCTAMSLLVHAAIGKFINPTRYRQIVETESSERLCPEEREALTQDQKHSSSVAKVFYQKRLSREVAQKGKECMEKLAYATGKSATDSLTQILNDIDAVNERCDLAAIPEDVRECADGNTVDNTARETISKVATLLTALPTPTLPPQIDNCEVSISAEVGGNTCLSHELKEEELDATKGGRAYVPFTKREDEQLRQGIAKYGRGNWSKIINDSELS